MKNNLEHPINCETGELNRPVGMAEAGQEDSDEPEGLAGTAYSREFGRGFKAGRESSQKIERAEPSRGAPPMTPDQFYRESDWHTSLGVAAKDMPPALIVTSRETAFAFAEAYANSRHVVLLEALKKLREWDKKWPKRAYIVEYGMISQSERELNEICELAEAAIQQAERT